MVARGRVQKLGGPTRLEELGGDSEPITRSDHRPPVHHHLETRSPSIMLMPRTYDEQDTRVPFHQNTREELALALPDRECGVGARRCIVVHRRRRQHYQLLGRRPILPPTRHEHTGRQTMSEYSNRSRRTGEERICIMAVASLRLP